MSTIISKDLLTFQMQKLINFFNNEVASRLTKKNKIIGISVAATMTLIYIIQDWALKPPRNLRHMPYVGYYSVIKSLSFNESFFERAHRVNLPLLNNNNKLAVYTVGFQYTPFAVYSPFTFELF